MLLKHFFETIYIPRKLRGKSPNSVRLYQLCLMQFARSLGREPTVDDLNEANVYLHLARRSNVAPATRNKELGQLLALWRLACRRGMLNVWPDIAEETEPERVPIAWMPAEIAKLFRAAEKAPGAIGGVPASKYWPAFLRLMLDTGERVGAIRDAEWSWISEGQIRIPAEMRKGKKRERLYRMSDETLIALNTVKICRASDTLIFPWPYTRNYFFGRYKKLVESAGLPTGRNFQTHCLRKTVGSAVHAAGLDAQQILDHSCRRDTKRYLDPRFTPSRQACDVLAEYLANPRKTAEHKRTG